MSGFFNDDERLKKAFGIKKCQKPLTKFIDNLDAIKVEMINWPDPERLKEHFIAFATSSWFENFFQQASQADIDEAIAELMNGRILAQGIEGVQFSFRISGMSLHGSHAFVRNRIGIAYLQQSQAIADYRDADVLVPRSYTKFQSELERYLIWSIMGKQLYSDWLDTEEIAVTDARFSYGKTVAPVWIHTSISLATILSIYNKRTDSQEEHPEMNLIAEGIRSEIVKVFPYMDGYFKRDEKCIHRFPGYRSNCVFARDENHKLKEGVKDNWTLHDKTKDELMTKGLEPFKTRFFIGYDEIDQKEYERIQKLRIG
jgi:hypothetical protein